MTAYGYIRKSVVHDPARMLSPETQEDAIRELAARNGDDDVTILGDLDVSGTRERNRRPGWDALLRAVEDGEATAVYAYSLSRFARSVAQLDYFFKLCASRGVHVRMSKDHIDTSSATGRLVSGFLAQLAEFEADIASERVKDAFAAKRVRDPAWKGPGNQVYGERPGEDPTAVVEAFRQAGSFDGAARLLNMGGIPCRAPGAVWSGSVVSSIVRRLVPEEVGPSVRRGAPAGRRAFRLSQLIACGTCGHFLTGSTGRLGDVRYQCARARTVPHARGWVSESKLLPVVKTEAERMAIVIRRMQVGSREDEAAMAALGEKRARIIDTYADGLIDKAERDRRIAGVGDQELRLTTRRWVRKFHLPPVIDTAEPARVNAYLRRLFARATVDMSKPALRGPSRWVPTIDFEWRDPSLRTDAPEAV